MASSSIIITVNDIKKSLTQELENSSSESSSSERAQDLLQRLDEIPMDVQVLTHTLIGTVVTKYKNHETVGELAKVLVKKWKLLAKNSSSSISNGGDPKATTAARTAAQRRDSASSKKNGSSSTEQEWAGLLPYRQSICQKIYTFLQEAKINLLEQNINEEAIDHLTGPRAAEIEGAIHKQFQDKQAYAAKARSLAFNLKKNVQLCQDVILGAIEADKLVGMSSEELASQETVKARAEQAKKLNDSKRLDWDQANEDKINEMCGIRGSLLQASLFTCGRCKSVKTTSTQKQTRSADEPMTVFVLCLNCGKRWKC
jgi:transcription elongation factor S-II